MHCDERLVSSSSSYHVYTPSLIAKKLFFYPIVLGYFYYEAGYTLKRNRFDSFLLMFITKGSCEITIGGETTTASKGSIVLIDCYAPHQYGSSTSWEAAWIHFDGPLARSYYEHIHSLYGSIFYSTHNKEIYYAFEKILNIFESGESINESIISKYITNMLLDIISLNTYSKSTIYSTSTLSSSFIDKTLSYINEHFNEAISLKYLADMVSLSPFYFSHLFTKETGMSPHQYIITARISYSKYLLKSTSIPIKEIAFSCGFKSDSSFCNSFKKCENITPSQYRSSSIDL